MYEHLKAHGILHRAQHVFYNGRSTCTYLLESVNDWTLSIEYKHSVKVAYVAFSQAFDSVSHEKLFARLASYGIRENLVQWLREYFSRCFTVRRYINVLTLFTSSPALSVVFSLLFVSVVVVCLVLLYVAAAFLANKDVYILANAQIKPEWGSRCQWLAAWSREAVLDLVVSFLHK